MESGIPSNNPNILPFAILSSVFFAFLIASSCIKTRCACKTDSELAATLNNSSVNSNALNDLSLSPSCAFLIVKLLKSTIN